MKTKSFFSGLSLLLFLNLLIKPAWIFLIDRQVQNAAGHEAYGKYFALFNLTYVLLFAADAGLTNMLVQRVAAGASINVRQLLVLKSLLLTFYLLLCFIASLVAGLEEWTTLLYLALIQCLSSLFVFLRGLLAARQLFKTDAFFSVLDKSLMLLFCAGPVYGLLGNISILLFVQLQLLATLLSTLLLVGYCFKHRLFQSAAQREKIWAPLKQATPFLLIVLLMAVHYRLDGILLERLHSDGARQAGIYAAGYRLLDAGNMIGYLCASFLVPFVARNRQNVRLVEKVILLTRHSLLAIGIMTATFAAVFAPWLQQVFYQTSDAALSRVMSLCLCVLPAYYLVHVYSSALTATNKLRPLTLVLFAAAVLNGVLNVLLIPSYGAAGACIAALISQWTLGLLLWVLASARLRLRWAAGSFGAYLGGGAICYVAFSLSKNSANAVWIILALVCLAALLLLVKQGANMKQLIFPRNS